MLHHPAGFARSKSRADVHRSSPPAACSFRFLSYVLYVHGPSVGLSLSLSLVTSVLHPRSTASRRSSAHNKNVPSIIITVRVFSLNISIYLSISLSRSLSLSPFPNKKRALVLFPVDSHRRERQQRQRRRRGREKPLCSSEGPRTKQKL